MRIVHRYSHLNGWEFLQVHHKSLWKEVIAVIGNVDASACRTKVSKEKRKLGLGNLFSPIDLNAEFKRLLTLKQWTARYVSYWVTDDAKLIRQTLTKDPVDQKADILAAGHQPIRSFNQTDFVKNRVAIEVQLGKYSFVAYDLFVKHLAFFVQDAIDVGIEV